jgi:hypothetical protein
LRYFRPFIYLLQCCNGIYRYLIPFISELDFYRTNVTEAINHGFDSTARKRSEYFHMHIVELYLRTATLVYDYSESNFGEIFPIQLLIKYLPETEQFA